MILRAQLTVKPKKLQVWGMLLEVIGLAALLIGAFWQAKMSGWWDQQLVEWQALIQEEVNLTVLISLNDISEIATSNDRKVKEFNRDAIRDNITRTITRSISERDRRWKEMRGGQAATFWSVRDFFMLSGTLLLVVGKLVSLLGLKSAEWNIRRQPAPPDR